MGRAIIQKEWIKTWRMFLLCAILSLAMAIYAVLRMNRLIELKGAEHLWLIMLLKDNSFVDVIKWTPLFSGLVIAMAQMLPEMMQKRLKLTLHLPYPQRKMILMMLAVGVVELFVIFAMQTAVIAIYDASILPAQLVNMVLATMMPWFYAGFIAYLIATAICIEGKRIRRILLALIGIALVMVFFEQSAMSAYNRMGLLTIVFIVLLVVIPLGSVVRFKEGLQD